MTRAKPKPQYDVLIIALAQGSPVPNGVELPLAS